MAKHNETGAKGEDIAAEYLMRKGYEIIHRNWRHGHKEVDMIAVKGDELVFVEIKTRGTYDFGYPEETVTKLKKQHLRGAATIYLMNNSAYETVRFDILSILMKKEAVQEIVHYEGAFY